MNLQGSDEYKLTIAPEAYKVECRNGMPRFAALSSQLRFPKLYIVSVDRVPIYVGMTNQHMRSRFYSGWKATGRSGYRGYAFRRTHTSADLSVWSNDDIFEQGIRDVETVEAEVVFLVRSAGQWPIAQTEIDFYPSTEEHRETAAEVMRHLQR